MSNKKKSTQKHEQMYAVKRDGRFWGFDWLIWIDYLSSDCLTSNQYLAEEMADQLDAVVCVFKVDFYSSYRPKNEEQDV